MINSDSDRLLQRLTSSSTGFLPTTCRASQLILLITGLCAFTTDHVAADAIVVTQAMSASTIAEVFVADGSVRIDLEIGVNDLPAFSNILPDDVYEKLTGTNEPAEIRHNRFFDQDLVLKVADQRLAGRVEFLESRRRIIRDPITGEPSVVQPPDAEAVIHAVLNYDLAARPTTLSITPPRRSDSQQTSANIGFIVYHNDLPVTDFRYLSTEETLDLDWEDPWYSRFRNKNLKRQFDAPLSAFLYVENFEVRKEIIVRPRDLQQWIDLGVNEAQILKVEQQSELKDRVARFLLERNPVYIDGKHVEATLDRIHFIQRTVRKTGVIEPPEDLDLNSATLGVIFVYPIEKLPQTVEMKWELFSERISQIPAVATDEAGGLPASISQEDPTLKWQNFLTNPTVPAMVSIPPPLLPGPWTIPLVSLVVFALTALAGFFWNRYRKHGPALTLKWTCIVGFITAIVLLPYGHKTMANPFDAPEPPGSSECERLFADLLHNTYRAFDRRDEEIVYDRLATSITGDLLTDVYVQVRRSMELENQGGASVKISDVELLSSSAPGPLADGGFVSRCEWMASGSVGHWGHIHQQANQYTAMITVQPVDGTWKISRLELIDESRSLPGGAP